MRITRGDNWTFMLLPGITLLALVGTFIGGKVYEFSLKEKQIIILSSKELTINKLSVVCDEESFDLTSKKNNIWELETKYCLGKISIEVNGVLAGSCLKSFDDFTKIEIKLNGNKVSEDDCSYHQ